MATEAVLKEILAELKIMNAKLKETHHDTHLELRQIKNYLDKATQ